MEQYYSFICLFWKFSPISNLVNVEITSHRYFNLFIGCLYLLELYLSYFCLFFIACMVLLLSTILICSFNIIHLEIFGPPIHFHQLFLKLTPLGGPFFHTCCSFSLERTPSNYSQYFRCTQVQSCPENSYYVFQCVPGIARLGLHVLVTERPASAGLSLAQCCRSGCGFPPQISSHCCCF